MTERDLAVHCFLSIVKRAMVYKGESSYPGPDGALKADVLRGQNPQLTYGKMETLQFWCICITKKLLMRIKRYFVLVPELCGSDGRASCLSEY